MKNKKQDMIDEQPPLDENMGCWYCYGICGELAFSCEFDTYVHLKCLKKVLALNDPNNREAQIMGRELLGESI